MARSGVQQEEGVVGRMVGGMIRRNVRKNFRALYWIRPPALPEGPVIFACSHHGWHDGYVMFHVVTALGRPSLDWIQEFDAFPLFRKVGGMPYPPNDPSRRAATVKETIRRLRSGERNLVMFVEGILHRGPHLLEFGRALEVVARGVPGCHVMPTAVRYDMSIHERPEAFVQLGAPLPATTESLCLAARAAVADLLADTDRRLREDDLAAFEVLARGTLDVNERMDMRRIPGRK